MVVSKTEVAFFALEDGANPDPNVLTIWNVGGGTLNWSIVDVNEITFTPPDWLTIAPTDGTLDSNESDLVTLSVDITGLSNGRYNYSFAISDPIAQNSPQVIDVSFRIGGASYVPADYLTIQAAIDAAIDDDTIIVSPGTYYENINFNGKNITLTSTNSQDPNATVIDGGQSGSVVTFSGTETSDCVLKGFMITNGYSSYHGGGIDGHHTGATITKCIISGNRADGGGGIYWSLGIIKDCVITNNVAYSSGGGLICCHGEITNCVISKNRSQGGGLYGVGGGVAYSTGEIVNCTIIANTAHIDGGGLARCDDAFITNCTIAGNSAAGNGGGLYNCRSPLTNCIIWGNNAGNSGNQIYQDLYGIPIPSYSCIQDWTEGGSGNIADDPLFSDTSSTDPAEWDLHLLSGSPCIDAGTNTPAGGLPATDIEGNPRPFDGDYNGTATVDMGAYEFIEFPEEPYLCMTPEFFTFSAFEVGSNPSDQGLTIKNFGHQTLNWSAELTDKPDWLTVTPASGSLNLVESENVMLSVDSTGLSEGFYSYAFEISDPAATNSPQVVTIDLEVIGAILNISENEFTFQVNEGVPNTNDQMLTITNSGGGIINWSVPDANLLVLPDWLTITPTSGTLEHDQSDNITLSVDMTDLSGGQYGYSFQISDPAAQNSPQVVDVSLRIGGTFHVPGDYPTIQAAIDAATDDDTIVVLPGTYYENINFNGKNITLASIDPQDPNVVASTIIDGAQNGSVVTFSGTETPGCVLSGFTITHGNSDDAGGGIAGGHDKFAHTHATIEYCIISENAAKWDGGGLNQFDGTITHCVVQNNTALWGGGLFGCNGTINNCTISNNDNTGVDSSGAAINNCTIANNIGAGLRHCYGSISYCRILNNHGTGMQNCSGVINNCFIMGNISAFDDGGGLYNCDGTISNCTITGNTADTGGGLYGCSGSILNCIIWGNSANQLYGCSLPYYSCIQDWTGGIGNISSDPLFVDPNDGDWHLQSEYGRWDTDALQWVSDDVTSPCIDAGGYWEGAGSTDPNSLFSDWRQELWPHGKRINMGAYGGTPAASMSPNQAGNMADLDRDEAVGVADLDLFGHDWLYEEFLLKTDLNLDGQVDMGDFALFAGEWLWHQGPCIFVSDTHLSFSTFDGGPDPVSQNFTILNTGVGILNWSIDTTDMPDWLTVFPADGTVDPNQMDTVTVSIDNSSLVAGSYSYTLEVSDPAADNNPQPVTVDLEVIGPILEISNSILYIVGYEGEPNLYSEILTVSNIGGDGLQWSIDDASKPEWLIITPTSGLLNYEQSEDVALQVNVANMDIGEYNYLFEVTNIADQNKSRAVEIRLLIGGDFLTVPEDFSMIQKAIDCVPENGTVLVSPGTYHENLVFPGIDFILTSTVPEDPNATIIDGDGNASVVTFFGVESPDCVLRGFTMKNGRGSESGGPPSSHWGGGVEGNGTRATINNCLITGNSAYFGAGLRDCDGYISYCTIISNSAYSGGGGAGGGAALCDGDFYNCLIIDNSSVGGGGLYECNGSLNNCVISGNSASYYGGGLFRCDSMITNCTIANNDSGLYGGGLEHCWGSITNCIFWNNSAGVSGDQIFGSSPTYSCIQDWTEGGTGNITSNPLFVNQSGGDLHLLLDSPCIDTGTNTPPGGLPDTDLDGNPRIIDGDTNGSATVDMGVYEYVP